MNRVIEHNVYTNILAYLDILGFTPINDQNVKEEKESLYTVKSKADIVKTLQFYSYVRVKASHKDTGKIMYTYIIRDNSMVSKSTVFKNNILNTISEKDVLLTIVSREGIKTNVLKFVKSYKGKKIILKDFKYDMFKIDLRDNVMVPKHELCTSSEKKKIMSDNFIMSDTKFPLISKNDPQVMWLGGEPGQLIRITRNDTTGPVLYYRIIVDK